VSGYQDMTTSNWPLLSLTMSSLTPRYKTPLEGMLSDAWFPIPNGWPLSMRPMSAPANVLGNGAPLTYLPASEPADPARSFAFGE
jgi:hypothetical protein